MTKSNFKNSYDVISVMSLPKITSKNIFQYPITITGYASGLGLIIWWSLKKAVLVLKK